MSRALVSIHDVMPETLDRVSALIERLPEPLCRGAMLLVVPGRDWRRADLARLGHWQDRGLELAGHGWTHHTDRIAGCGHWLHSRFFSRRVAEHLSLTTPALQRLLERNHHWFVQQGLVPPRLYVPPAWALGELSRADLAASPFDYVETLGGLVQCATGRRRRLPLLGFEADTPVRALALSAWNRITLALGERLGPPRLALHPYDAELSLAGSLWRTLARFDGAADYRELFPPPVASASRGRVSFRH